MSQRVQTTQDSVGIRSWQCFVGLHGQCDWMCSASQTADSIDPTSCACNCHRQAEKGGAQ